jgi:hypothetical protein
LQCAQRLGRVDGGTIRLALLQKGVQLQARGAAPKPVYQGLPVSLHWPRRALQAERGLGRSHWLRCKWQSGLHV